ncbi:SPOR domain-containing protein [Arthrobacter echini]|uniref:SPOR domain-containing protein n=1 Tax=Arthrobacter echini TaxID=1529066 RepID=A0A4S5E7E5_9MICC|nr:SPOR domain-containing protein [Arthrobacter echini]THJ67531.1 SPOR domain-containing protein [Arthrobacter echini]
MSEYWYNVRTREVEEDRQSDWKQLIGPYPTRAEAENALQKVQERNEAWDDDGGWGTSRPVTD